MGRWFRKTPDICRGIYGEQPSPSRHLLPGYVNEGEIVMFAKTGPNNNDILRTVRSMTETINTERETHILGVFGALVSWTRNEQKLSLRELANELDKDVSWLCSLERGAEGCMLDIVTLSILMRVLKLNKAHVEDIFAQSGPCRE